MDGQVWRFDDILPPADGHIQFDATAGGTVSTAGYLNAFMLCCTGSSTNRDGTGVTDMWKIQFFQSTNVNLQGDADSDGLSNLEEYIADTNPGSSNSVPGLAIRRTDTNATLTFEAAAERIYAVDFKTNMASPWLPLVSNVVGANTEQVINLTNSSASRFYRYRVGLAPSE